MGQAKVRKQLMGDQYGKDANPNYKKQNRIKKPSYVDYRKQFSKEQINIWHEQMIRSLNIGDKPDFGHAFCQETDQPTVAVVLTGSLLVSSDPYGVQVVMTTDNNLVMSILLNKKQATEIFGHAHFLKNHMIQSHSGKMLDCYPAPWMRFLSSDKTQWVIPFLVSSISDKEWKTFDLREKVAPAYDFKNRDITEAIEMNFFEELYALRQRDKDGDIGSFGKGRLALFDAVAKAFEIDRLEVITDYSFESVRMDIRKAGEMLNESGGMKDMLDPLIFFFLPKGIHGIISAFWHGIGEFQH